MPGDDGVVGLGNRAIMAWRRIGAVVLPALALAGAGSGARIDPPCRALATWSAPQTMQINVHRRGRADIVRLDGQIEADLPRRLAAVLAQHPLTTEIWMNASGSDIRAAIAAGRVIRANRGLLTRIVGGAQCVEACSFLFLGGSARVVHPDGRYFVPGFPANEPKPLDEMAAQGILEEADYLIRMGVSRRLLSEVVYRQSSSANAVDDLSPSRCLTQDELDRYNVTNLVN